jgi:hypothetical protein
MSTTILSRNAAKLPIASTFAMIYGSYEMHRVLTGTHPYWTPRLEAAGIESLKAQDKRLADSANNGAVAADAAAEHAQGVGAISLRWTSVNGIPIPTLTSFMGKSREE